MRLAEIDLEIRLRVAQSLGKGLPDADRLELLRAARCPSDTTYFIAGPEHLAEDLAA